jgi:hypothetical protein
MPARAVTGGCIPMCSDYPPPSLDARSSPTTASRLAVSIAPSVTSDAEEKVPTGGELTRFEAVDPGGPDLLCCAARRRSGMSGVT